MRSTLNYSVATAVLAAAALTVFARGTPAQSASDSSPSVTGADDKTSPILSSPIYGVTIPAGYRQWELIAPSHEAILDELRGILGNPVATKAYREGDAPVSGWHYSCQGRLEACAVGPGQRRSGKVPGFRFRASHDSSDHG